jgi:organic hydroperoxide reductase OsmC/OhrA
MTTFLAIARLSKLEFTQFSISARGKLDTIEGNGFQITSVVLRPRFTVHRERDLERAARIVRKAERNCLISNSIKTEVKVEPILENANPTGVGASDGWKSPIPDNERSL